MNFPNHGDSVQLITLQVLRWSALVFGVFYGFNRQRGITQSSEAAKAQSEYHKKEKLIEKAKLEWAKKTLPPQAKTASGDSMFLSPVLLMSARLRKTLTLFNTVIQDPNDKNFDLEAYLLKVEADSK